MSCVWSARDFETRRFLMFYEAVGAAGERTIGLAVSRDGLKDWQRLDRCEAMGTLMLHRTWGLAVMPLTATCLLGSRHDPMFEDL